MPYEKDRTWWGQRRWAQALREITQADQMVVNATKDGCGGGTTAELLRAEAGNFKDLSAQTITLFAKNGFEQIQP